MLFEVARIVQPPILGIFWSLHSMGQVEVMRKPHFAKLSTSVEPSIRVCHCHARGTPIGRPKTAAKSRTHPAGFPESWAGLGDGGYG
jgi:hypothetical protein